MYIMARALRAVAANGINIAVAWQLNVTA